MIFLYSKFCDAQTSNYNMRLVFIDLLMPDIVLKIHQFKSKVVVLKHYQYQVQYIRHWKRATYLKQALSVLFFRTNAILTRPSHSWDQKDELSQTLC